MSDSHDAPFDLARFIAAQASTHEKALAEIRAGRKTSHWMWFIFPQLSGLGPSAMSQRYAISGIDEARAYLAHPLLGPRIRECTEVLNQLAGRTAKAIFGPVDAMKLHSSLTLFTEAGNEQEPFAHCLVRYYGGKRDAATLRLLGREA
jgi:uncharacterized protein (DUF1810 family)